MKSVLQAGWLLTVAVGNIIVLIVAEAATLNDQVSGCICIRCSLTLGRFILSDINVCKLLYLHFMDKNNTG